MKIRTLGPLVACVLNLSGAPATAAPFLNGSFENGGVGILPALDGFELLNSRVNPTMINWWVVTQDSIEWVGTNFWQASDGLYSLDLSGSQPGAIAQTFDTIIGQTYQVLFDMAANPDENGSTTKSFQVSAAGTASTYNVDRTGHTFQDTGWTEASFLFTANDALTTLTFTSLTEGVYGPALDNVRVSAASGPLPLRLRPARVGWGGETEN
jgi:choice-of-anchor C domain-containing protein